MVKTGSILLIGIRFKHPRINSIGNITEEYFTGKVIEYEQSGSFPNSRINKFTVEVINDLRDYLENGTCSGAIRDIKGEKIIKNETIKLL